MLWFSSLTFNTETRWHRGAEKIIPLKNLLTVPKFYIKYLVRSGNKLEGSSNQGQANILVRVVTRFPEVRNNLGF